VLKDEQEELIRQLARARGHPQRQDVFLLLKNLLEIVLLLPIPYILCQPSLGDWQSVMHVEIGGGYYNCQHFIKAA
jgi:hypothetical protein